MDAGALNKSTILEVGNAIARQRGTLLPAFSLSLILVILIPLPTNILDFLLVTNLTFSAVILLTVMFMRSPLEFSSFPSVLLAMTLLRLVLNIATTRLILTNADQGTAAAGLVIQTFGHFVAGGSLIVGVIIFAIIVIIQFVVITKGATRIAEVAARFTLDGMPGKQMAVDADLNAGTINEEEAKRRRAQITQEADFYGAMDGASKFVRGDAIAGIIITVVNILGGLYVGMVELDPPLSFFDTLSTFTRLTIGDGLVSQIPAFIVSIGAAMIVTTSSSKNNLGEEIARQVTSQPLAMATAGAFLLLLTLTPLPKVPLIFLASACGLLFHLIRRGRRVVAEAKEAKIKTKPKTPERIENYLRVDLMELEIGYGLIKLVDRKQGGDLLDRVTNLRRQIAQDLGIVVPPIRMRDNVQLQPNEYVVKLKGLEIARGEIMPGHLLAIDSGTVTSRVGGVETKEPSFGLPALWITDDQRHEAEHKNYTVVEPTSVLATHLTEVIKQHADELLTRNEVARLLDNLKERSPKLIEETVGEVVKPGEIQAVLQNLLREGVPIRDLETILETLADWAPRTKDLEVLTEYARNALARTICHLHRSPEGKINCITLDPKLEELINANLQRSEQGTFQAMPPQVQQRVVEAIRATVQRAMVEGMGHPPVLLCPPQIRVWVRRMIEPVLSSVAVMSYNEVVRGVELESKGMVVLDEKPEDLSS
ncbi:MAG: flagellar biosynthesis protein FlhA [Phycisphaerae bacterium]|nr:flagellar biosynthesis protein FlhA [Phycisphaerae bacterium]